MSAEPDVVERLLASITASNGIDLRDPGLLREAADEITRLRSQVATMREALRKIARDMIGVRHSIASARRKQIAIDALASTEAAGEETIAECSFCERLAAHKGTDVRQMKRHFDECPWSKP